MDMYFFITSRPFLFQFNFKVGETPREAVLSEHTERYSDELDYFPCRSHFAHLKKRMAAQKGKERCGLPP